MIFRPEPSSVVAGPDPVECTDGRALGSKRASRENRHASAEEDEGEEPRADAVGVTPSLVESANELLGHLQVPLGGGSVGKRPSLATRVNGPSA